MPNESLGGRARARRAERADAPRMPIGRFATAPIATPPASVAFCTSAGASLPPRSSADAPNVATVEPHSAITVLTSAVCASTVPAGSAPPTKLGQYSQRKVVPTSDSTSETVDDVSFAASGGGPSTYAHASPKYAPNMWMMIVPPQSTTSSPGRMDRAPCGRARA